VKIGDLVKQIGWGGLGVVLKIGNGDYGITTVYWSDRGQLSSHWKAATCDDHYLSELEVLSEDW
jgi:hypothetical protein